MALQEKYAAIIDAATAAGVANLAVRDQDGVLYINGDAADAATKQQLWDIYGQIDPDFRAGDLILNITAPEGTTAIYTVVSEDNLTKIGKKFGKSWKEIYEANKAIIGENPDLIQIGWELQIPA